MTHSLNREVTREELYDKSKPRCPGCGIQAKLQEHHVTYVPERAIKICQRCHSLLTWKKTRRNFREYKKYEKDLLTQLYNSFKGVPKSRRENIRKMIEEIQEIGNKRARVRISILKKHISSRYSDVQLDEHGKAIITGACSMR